MDLDGSPTYQVNAAASTETNLEAKHGAALRGFQRGSSRKQQHIIYDTDLRPGRANREKDRDRRIGPRSGREVRDAAGLPGRGRRRRGGRKLRRGRRTLGRKVGGRRRRKGATEERGMKRERWSLIAGS